MEIAFADSPNDYLVYGVTEELLLRYPELYRHDPQSFSGFAGSTVYFSRSASLSEWPDPLPWGVA